MQREPQPERPARRPGTVRRVAALAVLRALLTTAGLVTAYYLLPLDRPFSAGTVLGLLGGLMGVAGMLAWQVRVIVRSNRPRLRAVQALSTTFPLFLLLFAATYFLLERNTPASFTEPLSRTDALYFTVTVFSTVGFGDIAPRTELARLLTVGQILGDLLLIGVAARVLLDAVQEGVRRQLDQPPDN
jgi:hypothetical protein